MKTVVFLILTLGTLTSTFARTTCDRKIDLAYDHFEEGRREYRVGGKAYNVAKKEMERFWHDKKIICENLIKTRDAYKRSTDAFYHSYMTFDSATRSCSGRDYNDAIENREISEENHDHVSKNMRLLKKSIEEYNCSN